MKFLRFSYENIERYGVIEGDAINEITNSYFEKYDYTGKKFRIDEVKVLPPSKPSKVVAVGLNYIDHIKEMGHDMPKTPVLFIKLPDTIIGHEDTIIIPQYAVRVDYEAELAVVISKECRNVSPEEADNYILGATCLNDVTEREIQKIDGQWTRAKNLETFCPVGPIIVSEIDYNNLDVKLMLNGQQKQSSNTSNLLWNVQQLVSFISNFTPLHPGDIVTTGTTFGIGPMKDGDVVELTIEDIGTLRNFVKNAE